MNPRVCVTSDTTSGGTINSTQAKSKKCIHHNVCTTKYSLQMHWV